MKTKKQVVEDKIAENVEDIFTMEIVRDFNTGVDTPEAKIQVDAAIARIKKDEVQLAWLKEHLKTLE